MDLKESKTKKAVKAKVVKTIKLKRVDRQGHRANKNGAKLENAIVSILEGKGAKLFRMRKKQTSDFSDATAIYMRQVPYTNIFNEKGRGDFYLLSNKLSTPVRIEARSQKVAGSAVDKLSCLLDNCAIVPETHVVVVLEGPAFKQGHIDYAKGKAQAITHKNVEILNLNEFESWASENI